MSLRILQRPQPGYGLAKITNKGDGSRVAPAQLDDFAANMCRRNDGPNKEERSKKEMWECDLWTRFLAVWPNKYREEYGRAKQELEIFVADLERRGGRSVEEGDLLKTEFCSKIFERRCAEHGAYTSKEIDDLLRKGVLRIDIIELALFTDVFWELETIEALKEHYLDRFGPIARELYFALRAEAEIRERIESVIDIPLARAVKGSAGMDQGDVWRGPLVNAGASGGNMEESREVLSAIVDKICAVKSRLVPLITVDHIGSFHNRAAESD